MPQFIIIADDLTGANDTGVQFAKKGFSTVSLLDLSQQEYIQDAEVLVYNAETRSLEPNAAYECIKTIANQLPFAESSCIYKKIDSTMRGNVGAEMDGIMDVHKFDLAVVVPAYPKGSRLTVGGYHLVHQALLEDSEFSKDPKCPVKESYLPSLLARQTRRKIGHIGIKEIRNQLDLAKQIKALTRNGTQIILFDAAVQHDLKAVAEAVACSGLRCLWVGSAGLAQSLADQSVDHDANEFIYDRLFSPSEDPIFVIAGSVSEVTKQQVQQLSNLQGYKVISADPLGILDEDSSFEWERLVNQILEVIDQGHSPILTTDSSVHAREAVQKWGNSQKKDSLFIGNRIADQLGRLGSYIMSQRKFSGLIATGGDIAFRFCHHMEVKALRILDEVEPGIPLSQIIGGSGDGLPIVTKAGAFGNPSSFVNAVNKIKENKTFIRGIN
ncbi:four-carbon acid sugar kinase family protein [Ammoniphilus sp. 3BR4]|uniref:four-carbon acid sugar kinase family protein n=1 Tax=Ammoniphilus sp. 3BR4 TaxID=3158265 RepID=UPI003467E960